MTDTITIPRATVQQALEALERYQVKRQDFDQFAAEVTALRTALAKDEALQAMNDLLTTGTGVMLDGKRVDPASMYKPVANQCKGIPRKGCNYLTACDTVCNKCGEIHHHHLMAFNHGISSQQQAEPIGWLDGNDKLAEFMHRDLKAEHDKRGSATPKDFTIPVYTTLPQQQAEPVAWTLTKTLNKRETTTRGYLWFSNPQNYLWTPLYTTPPQRKPLTDEQADQIISGLQTCHHQSSKREFLKVWLRDWAAHGIKEQP